MTPAAGRPLQMTIAQVAAEFGGRSAQWLRRQVAGNPAFADFPAPDRRTGLYRTAQVMAWLERDDTQAATAAPRARRAPQTADEWTQELAGRPV